jgi:hypothetical protein
LYQIAISPEIILNTFCIVRLNSQKTVSAEKAKASEALAFSAQLFFQNFGKFQKLNNRSRRDFPTTDAKKRWFIAHSSNIALYKKTFHRSLVYLL